jgi:hypothetical protein
MPILSALLIFLFVTSMVPAALHAQPMGRGMHQGAPYGHYCPGLRWGPYGTRKPVRTVAEARQVMELYLSGNAEGVHAGKIEEKDSYFEAEILGRDEKPIDRAIVDKRTGRIRTIY